MTTPASPTPRKPYAPPTLETFGDLTQLTHAVANNSTVSDNGSMNMQKTF